MKTGGMVEGWRWYQLCDLLLDSFSSTSGFRSRRRARHRWTLSLTIKTLKVNDRSLICGIRRCTFCQQQHRFRQTNQTVHGPAGTLDLRTLEHVAFLISPALSGLRSLCAQHPEESNFLIVVSTLSNPYFPAIAAILFPPSCSQK
jgi:hypothetical protein